MRLANLHILLRVDNAPCHVDVELSHVNMLFFFPNATSEIHPLDQDIILDSKLRYQKLLLQILLLRMDGTGHVSQLSKKINVLDTLRWINTAWKDAERNTVVKGYRNAGFPTDCFDSTMNFANGDKYVETTEVLSSSKGEAELLSMKNAKKWMQIQSEDENQSITPEKIISHKKFAASLEKMKNFAVQKQPQLLRHVQHLETAF
ncbi:DNA topoisomerase 2-alpha [Trichinella spiralis]|uniref:DNA topoisomerase 2-alpha n=1 Tax=Trichinella spiralis TaxID=6334 RepID=UPI0001EFC278|nr:DNA topoisomerase 2-alpha [Trichinella spiralis]